MSSVHRKVQVVLAALHEASERYQFLLLQTNEARGKFWQNITGSVEKEEEFEEASLREAIEETGLKLEGLVEHTELGGCFEFEDSKKRKVKEKPYLIIMEKTWKPKLDPKEHQDFKWVFISDLSDEMVKYESNYECLLRARDLIRHRGL